ncbi:hypothetical protein MMC30_002585 [Trapelia coarctata]|nr:hypothetical protein [Trapelia coarctata]
MVSTTEQERNGDNREKDPETAIVEAPYCSFSRGEKAFIVTCVSAAAFFSPVSSNIYFPALNVLAAELNVSNTLINLTLTSFLIFQGLAPTFIGSFSDVAGRRPAYLICFILYLAANIGLALQTNYAALFILRCLQSSGSSGTVTLAIGVVADIATTAERGTYLGYAIAGVLLGPAFGPLIGGVLTQYLGWRSIFWFLTIVAGVVLLIFMIFFPETCRAIVGNGSIPPNGWNMSALNWNQLRRQKTTSSDQPIEALEELRTKARAARRIPNPADSLRILFEKEGGLILLFSAVLFAGFYGIVGAIPSQYVLIYGFNDLQIGLCYIPVGIGAMVSALLQGRLIDWNFKRHAKRLGIPITKGRQQVLKDFPIERARLEVALPMIYISSCLLIGYGWAIEYNAHLAAPLVLLFFVALTLTGSFNVMSTLIVDLHPGKAGAATAANNLARCLLGAGFTAAIIPMIDRMGRGWTYTFMAFVWLLLTPLLLATIKYGPSWREARRVRDEKAKAKVEENESKTSTTATIENGTAEKMMEESPTNGTVARPNEEAQAAEEADSGDAPVRTAPVEATARGKETEVEAFEKIAPSTERA